MYAQAAIKPNTLLRNGAYGIVMRGVQKCTCAGASLRSRNSAPLCCIKLDTATDPACGSGNFLTETYISIRRLENKVLSELQKGQIRFGFEDANPIQVSIAQFYGIEINDFAVTVAKTALWIAESQMMNETEAIVLMPLDFLPLKTNASIIEGNALRINWEDVVPKTSANWIISNPPFVGARMMGKAQKEDIALIFSGWENAGNLDYVCCWYKKCADFMINTTIRSAFVSTNSVSQGESVANLWKPLFEEGVHIDFAHRTFRWDSEAKIKAHVHCVIIGFSMSGAKEKVIYTDNRPQVVNNINGYLVDAPNVFVEPRNKPLCDVPSIGIRNKPIDGGFYLFDKSEMEEFLKSEPKAEPYFHEWYGVREFINHCPRYCLYLANCPVHELRKMPEALKRVEAVKQYRSESSSAGTRKLAETPTRFHVTNIPDGNYIVIPQVSSERRRYIPMGYMAEGVLCSDKVRLMPEGNLYHFGILESNVHMSWMRAICCRVDENVPGFHGKESIAQT